MLIIILISTFILQSLVELISQNYSNLIFQYFSFSSDGLFSLFLWTPLSYIFLHDGPIHLIMNLLGLFFIGRSVENLIGNYKKAKNLLNWRPKHTLDDLIKDMISQEK